VLVGDYHGFSPAQERFLLLARALLARGASPSLALEAFPAGRDAPLEAFLRGAVPEAELLRRCRLRSRWPFDLRGLLRILRWARWSEIRAFGIDPPFERARRTERDRGFATAIERALRERRDRPILVLVGSAHLGALARLLRRRRVLTVSFVERERRSSSPVIREGSGRFAVRGFSPALAAREFLDRAKPPEDPTDRVADLAERLARLIGAPRPDPSEIGVVEDPGRTRRAGRLAFREDGLIYVRNAGPRACAEAASLALRLPRLGGDGPFPRFLEEVRGAALGFFAGRLLDPDRSPEPPSRHLPRAVRLLPRWERALERIRRSQARWLSHGEARGLRASLRSAPRALAGAAARSLGEVLGARWIARSEGNGRKALRRRLLSRRLPVPFVRDLRQALLGRDRVAR
jgi:hypothetical protein